MKFSEYPVQPAILSEDQFIFLQDSTTSENLITCGNLINSIVVQSQVPVVSQILPNTLVARDAVGDIHIANLDLLGDAGSGVPDVRYGHIRFASYPGSPILGGDEVVLLNRGSGDPMIEPSVVVRGQGGIGGITSAGGFVAGVTGFQARLDMGDIVKLHNLPAITLVSSPLFVGGGELYIQAAAYPNTPGYMYGSDRGLLDSVSQFPLPTSLVQRLIDGSGKFTDLRLYDDSTAGATANIFMSGSAGIIQSIGWGGRTGTAGAWQADNFNISWDGTHAHLWHGATDLGYFNLT